MPDKDEELGWHARHVLNSNPEFFGTPETWDPKHRRQQEEQMAKDKLSIDDVGKPENLYENLPVLEREEALHAIALEMYSWVNHYWIQSQIAQTASPEERVLGAVETVLDILQNGTPYMPPFKLVASDPLYWEEPTSFISGKDRDVAKRFEIGQVIDPSGSLADGDVTLTSSFAAVYDTHKRRMWAAASDLFATPNKYDREN